MPSTMSLSFWVDLFQGELEHWRMKRQYPCSGKKKDSMTRSIANQEAIERFIKKVSNAYEKTTNMMSEQPDVLPYNHYSIAKSACKSSNLLCWLGELQDNPAYKVSLLSWPECCTKLNHSGFFPSTSRSYPCLHMWPHLWWRWTWLHQCWLELHQYQGRSNLLSQDPLHKLYNVQPLPWARYYQPN